MTELNQNKKLQQPGWPDSVWKHCFNLEINHMQQVFTRILQNGCSKKTCEKSAKLISAYEKLIWKFCGSIP